MLTQILYIVTKERGYEELVFQNLNKKMCRHKYGILLPWKEGKQN